MLSFKGSGLGMPDPPDWIDEEFLQALPTPMGSVTQEVEAQRQRPAGHPTGPLSKRCPTAMYVTKYCVDTQLG